MQNEIKNWQSLYEVNALLYYSIIYATFICCRFTVPSLPDGALNNYSHFVTKFAIPFYQWMNSKERISKNALVMANFVERSLNLIRSIIIRWKATATGKKIDFVEI